MLQYSSAQPHGQPHLNFIPIPHPNYTSHVCHKRYGFPNSDGQIQWRVPSSLPPRSTSLPLVLQFPPLIHTLHSWLQRGLIWFKMGEPIRDLSEVHFNDIRLESTLWLSGSKGWSLCILMASRGEQCIDGHASFSHGQHRNWKSIVGPLNLVKFIHELFVVHDRDTGKDAR